MRLFLGIEIPEKCQKIIFESIKLMQSSPKGWENPHDYHLTLLFMGEVDDTRLEEIKERMQNIVFKAFTLKTTDVEFFNRRIMYLGIQSSPNLEKLRLTILENFFEWKRPEEKEFVPHITLKRWQRYEFQKLAEDAEFHKILPLSFEVDHLALYLSHRDEHGRKYHIIARSPLHK